MELITYPNPILRRRAVPVEEIDDEVRDRIREMFQIMYAAHGVGLAAPQVGWSVRLFVVNTKIDPDPDPAGEKVYINPEITLAEGQVVEEEGCLSIPGVRGKVARHERIEIRALDVKGKPFAEDVRGLEARALQHEFDHLDGILFLSRLSVSDRLLVGKALKKLEKEYKQSVRIKS